MLGEWPNFQGGTAGKNKGKWGIPFLCTMESRRFWIKVLSSIPTIILDTELQIPLHYKQIIA